MPTRGPAYRIVTERTVVRCWEPRDAPLLKEAIDASLEHLRPWMPWAKDEPTSVEDKVELLRTFRGRFDLGQDAIYGIFDRDESVVLGGTGLHPRAEQDAREIGYWMRADRTGRGLCTEVCAALVRVGFDVLGLERVDVHCDPTNARSAAVPHKLGFVHEATLRHRIPRGFDAPRDTMVWSLIADEYPSSPAAKVGVSAWDAAGLEIPLPAPRP